jgi:iron complex outermembrane receptor protein
MTTKRTSAVIIWVLSASTVFARQSPSVAPCDSGRRPQRAESVIVTGTYQPIPLEESDRVVDAIDFSNSHLLYGTWVDGLRSDPSVDVQQRAPGVQADLSIRGSSFGQTLVLIDGLRVNDAQSGHHNLDIPIPFATIERIEVLHGSGSTLYGSDAVGGAVNFITASPTRTELVLGAGAGNFGANQQFGSLSYARKGISEALGFTRDFSSGFMPDRDYRNLALYAESRFATRLGTSAVLLGLSDRPFGADQFYGDFPSWERTKGWFIGATQDLGEQTQAAFGYRRHTDQFILFRDEPSIYENNHVTESYQFSLRRHDRLTDELTLFYGAEAYRDTIDSNNLGYHGRNQGAFSAVLSYSNHKKVSLSGGARVETYSRGETQLSPQIVLGYRLSSRLKFRASVSHAFRLPTYTDLYYSDPANLGNPNLKPERAWSYEAGVLWNLKQDVAVEITGFTRRERDGIDYVRSSADAPWQAANIDRLNFTGIEVLSSIGHGISKFQLGYTGIYGAQQSSGALASKYVHNYPVNQATAGWLGRTTGRIELRARLGVTNRYNQGAYPLAEFSATRAFGVFSPYLKVTNVSNTGYEEVDGVRMPGRTCIAGMELRLTRDHSDK